MHFVVWLIKYLKGKIDFNYRFVTNEGKLIVVLVSFQETRAVKAVLSIMCKAGVIPQILSSWSCASQLNINKNPTDATVYRYLFTAKLLYMFRVSKHPSSGVLKSVTAASGTGHNTGAATSLQRGLFGT